MPAVHRQIAHGIEECVAKTTWFPADRSTFPIATTQETKEATPLAYDKTRWVSGVWCNVRLAFSWFSPLLSQQKKREC